MSHGNVNAPQAQGVATKVDTPLTRSARGWLAHLRVERGAAENTLTSYQRDLTRYVQFLGSHAISDPAVVRESDVTEFLACLREGTPQRPRCRRLQQPGPLWPYAVFTGSWPLKA